VKQASAQAVSRRHHREEGTGLDRRDFEINIYGLGLMALWTTVNTIVLPMRIEATAPARLQGSALGLVGLVGTGIAALAQPVAGRVSDAAPLSDRRRPFILAGTVLALPGIIGFGWTSSFALLLLGYVLLQVAANVAQAAFQALIPDLVDERQRGAASGAKNALTVAGAALGLLGARRLIAAGAGSGAILIFLAVVLVATAGLTALWVPAIPPLPKNERQGCIAHALNPRHLWRSFAETWNRSAPFRKAVIAQFLFLLGTYPAQRFLLLFLEDRFGSGASASAAAGLAGAIVLAAIAATVAGWLSDTIGRTSILIVSIVLASVGMAGIGFAPSLAVVAIAGGLVAVGNGAFQAVNWALLSDHVPEGEGATAFGLANIATAGAGALAGLFGPLVDLMDAVMPAGTYQLTFGLAALVALTSLFPVRSLARSVRTQ